MRLISHLLGHNPAERGNWVEAICPPKLILYAWERPKWQDRRPEPASLGVHPAPRQSKGAGASWLSLEARLGSCIAPDFSTGIFSIVIAYPEQSPSWTRVSVQILQYRFCLRWEGRGSSFSSISGVHSTALMVYVQPRGVSMLLEA